MFSIYDRSDFEMFTQGNADTILRLITPRFGISRDKRLRVRWLFWALYFGKKHV
jgi:hypothetical protein